MNDIARPYGDFPAIVLGVESQIGLAIVRELGRAGVRVIAVTHDPHAIGLASRYAWRRIIVGPPRSDSVIDAINALAAELGRVSLLAVSEANLLWLDRQRARIRPDIGLAVPATHMLASVLDKSKTLSIAGAIGIAVPKTVEPTSRQDIERIAPTFPFPAVLKWKDSNAIAPRLATAGLALVKAEYVYTAEELRDIGRRYAPVGEWPLVQQYCRGQGLGQFFFMRGGHAIRVFQHRRVAEWPPEGGYSSVCDAVPLDRHQALQRQSIALLRALDWEGVAMVEYRHDAVNDRSVLMEVNGRFWGSLPLAVAAGAGFALHAHAAAIGARPPELAQPRSDLRCRMLATEAKRLVRLWLAPSKIADRSYRAQPMRETLRFVVDFFRPRVRYFVLSPDDLRPVGRDILNMLLRRS